MLEARDVATLGVHSAHHVLDRAVFSSGIHRLKNDEQRVTLVCIKKILLRAELLDVMRDQLSVVVLRRMYKGFTLRRLTPRD